jgi:hypothetical protein
LEANKIQSSENIPTILFRHSKYTVKLSFGNDQDKISIISNNRIIDNIYFYGFRGFISSPLFDEILKRPSALQEKYFSDFMKSLKFTLLKKIITITKLTPELYSKHRNLLAKIACDTGFGSELDRLELGKEIPVKLHMVGWKKIKELTGKNVFVEVISKDKVSQFAERAASMGYSIVCAGNQSEKVLLKKIIDANNIKLLPDFLLKDASTTMPPDDNLKTLIKNADKNLDNLTSNELQAINSELFKINYANIKKKNKINRNSGYITNS